jgi:hypothetical protein
MKIDRIYRIDQDFVVEINPVNPVNPVYFME